MPYSERTWEVLYGNGSEDLDEETRDFHNRYRQLLVLFGDAAGAMVFRAHSEDDGRGMLGSELYGDGDNKEILYVPEAARSPGPGSTRR